MKKIVFLLFAVLFAISAQALEHVVGSPDGFVTYNYTLTGGEGGQVVDVYTAADLATYLDTEGPLIIRIHGDIALSGEIPCRSNKTIVGVGDDATISNSGIALNKRENVIFQNIHFIYRKAGDDLIKINNSQRIWVDHCSFSDGGADPNGSDFDGTLDICKGSDFITVSYCHFFNHSKNVLMSSSDGSGNTDTDKLRTTFHHCWFEGTYQRNPRVRFGIVHVYNNYYTDNTLYSIASCENAKVLVEDNYFKNCPHPGYGVSGYADSGAGYLWSRGTNVFDNSNEAEFKSESSNPPANPSISWDPKDYYDYTPIAASEVPAIVMLNAGAGKLYADPDKPYMEKPSNMSQSVQTGSAIEEIVFSWYGAATDVQFVGLPSEITVTKEGRTATLSGIPAATFAYSVSTTGGNSTITYDGTITVFEEPIDPDKPEGQIVLADWYPFQETTISLDFLSSNGAIDVNRSSSTFSNGAINISDNSKHFNLTLPSLAALKINVTTGGSRTLKVTYGATGSENTWSKQYKSGDHRIDLVAEIPALNTTEPIIVKLVNDRTSSGTFYIHDLYVSAYDKTVAIPTTPSLEGKIVSETIYTLSGLKVDAISGQGVFIKRIVYENGAVETIKTNSFSSY